MQSTRAEYEYSNGISIDFSRREFQLLPLLDGISRDIFGYGCPKARDLEYYMQLVLVNTHPAIDYPEPLPPNVIPVGGLQIVDAKPLPKVMVIIRCLLKLEI